MSEQLTSATYTAACVAKHFSFKLTALREQVVALLLEQSKPIKAYDLLAKLKLIRPTAKPPTIYRVLEYLVGHGAVIRLEACNSYILAAVESVKHAANSRMTMVFRSKVDGKWMQFSDPGFDQLVMDWERQHRLRLHPSVIELHGEFLPDNCSEAVA